ncbi:MAG: UDP-N-acetylmuramoyl-L-alanyl-D-glutamate--2,6-diaminopimelate ligase [Candidatus Moranbacteria bacterium CG_4_9_14_3_um_filter_42_9]|nr:MAG: UDP-N-acetylmuramoyl-L-alanyl-D-glutamate--2,6-diaminopimelate ligase [Candidatus Moranbacteria bacterium CG_4_9_14_3_um_filter_42_9]
MKDLVPRKIKNIYHMSMAFLANVFYGFPSKKLKVIGVTGTNGKTTTIMMITKILEEGGLKVAMASTIRFKIGEKEWVNRTKFTTMSAWAIQKFFREAVDTGCEYMMLETSSHSLDQNRIWGINFRVGVVTNVTREHLDYHKSMERYREIKLKLFRKIKVAVVNLDMENPEQFLDCQADKKYGYTLKGINARPEAQNFFPDVEIIPAEDIKFQIDGTSFKVGGTQINLHLAGGFNTENAMAAIAAGLSEGIDFSTMKKALEKIMLIPGRIEPVPNERSLNIIIDYAVTPDSLEKLYGLVKEIRDTKKGGRIISIFGSCGERDRGKRPMMGKIVSTNADLVIVTNEDPYGEEPLRIISEISEGIQDRIEGKNFWKILDRRKAIKKALQLAESGDFVIVTGKGAEETMAIGKERIPWNDKKVIQEVLQELESKQIPKFLQQ